MCCIHTHKHNLYLYKYTSLAYGKHETNLQEEEPGDYFPMDDNAPATNQPTKVYSDQQQLAIEIPETAHQISSG